MRARFFYFDFFINRLQLSPLFITFVIGFEPHGSAPIGRKTVECLYPKKLARNAA